MLQEGCSVRRRTPRFTCAGATDVVPSHGIPLPGVRCKRLILIEAPSSASHRGMLRVAKTLVTNKEETSMRLYTQQHQFYCGIDLHARTMYVCILHHDGEIVVPRHRPTRPEALLKTIAPYREQIVMAVACLFTWYWLADLSAREGMPCVLGHALYMKAIHGGKAKHDTIDAQKMAVLRRGGMLPHAYVSPAEMRAPRDLRRRRRPLMRKRAELLTHVQHTTWQDNVPEMGKKIASTANRAGVA